MSVCWRHHGISHHSLSGWGGGRGVSNTTVTWVWPWVWPLKGVLNTNTTEHNQVWAFTHSFIQWLSRDSWAFRLLQPIPMVWVVISPCVINHVNYSVVQNQRSGVLSSLWFTSWGSSQPAMVGPADCSRYDVRWFISGRLSCWDLVLAEFGQLPKFWLYSAWSVNRQFCLICLRLTHPAGNFRFLAFCLSAFRKTTCSTLCSDIKSLFTSLASDIGTTMGQCCLWPSTSIYVWGDL